MIINGWVEVRPKSYDATSPWHDDRRWLGIIRIAPLIRLSYGAFNNLFAIERYGTFARPDSNGGIPDDASEEVERDWGTDVASRHQDEVYSPAWITWPALAQLDWEEESESRGLFRYRHDESGTLVEEGRASWTPEYTFQVFDSEIGDSIRAALWSNEERTLPIDESGRSTASSIAPAR